MFSIINMSRALESKGRGNNHLPQRRNDPVVSDASTSVRRKMSFIGVGILSMAACVGYIKEGFNHYSQRVQTSGATSPSFDDFKGVFTDFLSSPEERAEKKLMDARDVEMGQLEATLENSRQLKNCYEHYANYLIVLEQSFAESYRENPQQHPLENAHVATKYLDLKGALMELDAEITNVAYIGSRYSEKGHPSLPSLSQEVRDIITKVQTVENTEETPRLIRSLLHSYEDSWAERVRPLYSAAALVSANDAKKYDEIKNRSLSKSNTKNLASN